MKTTQLSPEAIKLLDETHLLARRVATWDRLDQLGAPLEWLEQSHHAVTASLNSITHSMERLHQITLLRRTGGERDVTPSSDRGRKRFEQRPPPPGAQTHPPPPREPPPPKG